MACQGLANYHFVATAKQYPTCYYELLVKCHKHWSTTQSITIKAYRTLHFFISSPQYEVHVKLSHYHAGWNNRSKKISKAKRQLVGRYWPFYSHLRDWFRKLKTLTFYLRCSKSSFHLYCKLFEATPWTWSHRKTVAATKHNQQTCLEALPPSCTAGD